MPEWIHTLTIDASYDRPTRTSGVGIVVQARTGGSGRGSIIDRIAEAHVGLPPGLGEMFAVLRALEIASDRGFTRIRIRSDYNSMRRMLRERFRSGTQGRDDLQQRILDLAQRFEWIDFGYVPRRKNQLAHLLARQGRFLTPETSEQEPAVLGNTGAQRSDCTRTRR
ncbi:MAG TPA: ribonuclease H family protein [Pyrinomonadaceae bacterium]|nr:ribonuclease H family protein [Pyrinomonadaceae bacterium]